MSTTQASTSNQFCRVADIKYGALAEVEEALKRKQAEARRSDRMLSDTVSFADGCDYVF